MENANANRPQHKPSKGGRGPGRPPKVVPSENVPVAEDAPTTIAADQPVSGQAVDDAASSLALATANIDTEKLKQQLRDEKSARLGAEAANRVLRSQLHDKGTELTILRSDMHLAETIIDNHVRQRIELCKRIVKLENDVCNLGGRISDDEVGK